VWRKNAFEKHYWGIAKWKRKPRQRDEWHIVWDPFIHAWRDILLTSTNIY